MGYTKQEIILILTWVFGIILYYFICRMIYTFIGVYIFERKKEDVKYDFDESNLKDKNKWSFVGILGGGNTLFFIIYMFYALISNPRTDGNFFEDVVNPFLSSTIAIILFVVYNLLLIFLINYLEKQFESNSLNK